MGTGLALTLLGIISMIVMLTPLAPGNVVDVCGGFVIVQILMQQEHLTFWEAWVVAIFAVCFLHFNGACAQWFIGKQPCVQAWANASLPVAMLAASDAVLKEASFFKVGLIGYIFMDTANGLNQGRINMEFWTQLLSEWTCFPNAIPLVSLGATVAVSGDKSLVWTKMALPVLLLLATCWQVMGTSFGARAMGASTDTDKYWKSREKWTLIQFFNNGGYTATQEGWKRDVYQLAKTDQEIYAENGNNICLYEKVDAVHEQYLNERAKLQTEEERVVLYHGYQEEVRGIREGHITKLRPILKTGIKYEWLIYKKPVDTIGGWFDREENIRYRMGIILVLVVCYWMSIIGIYNEIYMQEAVVEGVGVFKKITSLSWLSFCLFIALELVYFHHKILSGLRSMGSSFSLLFGGCKFDSSIETKFDTPKWETAIELSNIPFSTVSGDHHGDKNSVQ